MKSEEYKRTVAKPNVKRRNVIEETIHLLSFDNLVLLKKLERVLSEPPIEKPVNHIGGRETDFFEINLTRQEIEEIVEILGLRESAAVPTESDLSEDEIYKSEAEANRIAMILDEWNRELWG